MLRCTTVSFLLICLLAHGLPGGPAWCQTTGLFTTACGTEAGPVDSCCGLELPAAEAEAEGCCSDPINDDQPSVVPMLLALPTSAAVVGLSLPPWQLQPSDRSVLRTDTRPWWPPDPGARDQLRELRSIRLLI